MLSGSGDSLKAPKSPQKPAEVSTFADKRVTPNLRTSLGDGQVGTVKVSDAKLNQVSNLPDYILQDKAI